MNMAVDRTVVITLEDEGGMPVIIWTLKNARLSRISGTDLDSSSNEVIVDLVELVFETLVQSTP